MKVLPFFSLVASLLAGLQPSIWAADEGLPAHLPGELSADQVLNGEYPFPPSPRVEVKDEAAGFAAERMSKVPAPALFPFHQPNA